MNYKCLGISIGLCVMRAFMIWYRWWDTVWSAIWSSPTGYVYTTHKCHRMRVWKLKWLYIIVMKLLLFVVWICDSWQDMLVILTDRCCCLFIPKCDCNSWTSFLRGIKIFLFVLYYCVGSFLTSYRHIITVQPEPHWTVIKQIKPISDADPHWDTLCDKTKLTPTSHINLFWIEP